MSDYYTYRHKVNAQKRGRRAVLALLAVVAGLCALAGWIHFSAAAPVAAEVPQPTAAPLPTPVATPTPETAQTAYIPQRLLPAVDAAAWDTSAAAAQTIDLEYLNTDARMIGLPALGRVETSYFDTVTFLGDSITSGLGIYDTGLKNAHYVAYIGAGPSSVVNNGSFNNAVTHVSETPLETLVASAPDRLYILFGTNSLVTQGNEESFIAYYDRMIDILREQLPGVVFYMQAIPGVQEWVRDSKPGLDNDRIRIVNNLLANLALRKGCYFVNIAETLNNADGSQIDEYEVKDGIHLQPSGYGAWVEYLATHTAWDRRNLYSGENPYYILGT